MEQKEWNENKTPTFIVEGTIFAFAGYIDLVIFIHALGISLFLGSRTQCVFGLRKRGKDVRGGDECGVV